MPFIDQADGIGEIDQIDEIDEIDLKRR